MNKQLILSNLDAAVAAVEAFPAERIDLGNYTSAANLDNVSDCGTLFCVAGILAVTPHFTQQGWDFEEIGPGREPGTMSMVVTIDGDQFDSRVAWGSDVELCDLAFGPDSWCQVFNVAGGSVYDDELPGNPTDKEYALHRLRRRRKDISEDLL